MEYLKWSSAYITLHSFIQETCPFLLVLMSVVEGVVIIPHTKSRFQVVWVPRTCQRAISSTLG